MKLDQRVEMLMENQISEVTRRAIIDYFSASEISWSGRLTEDEFLSRLYDLAELPSKDNRFKSAAGDIYQHCVNNRDWPDDWVFFDSRFKLLYASDDEFLRFLCESAHPVIRPSTETARKLVENFNAELRRDGWEIFESKSISEKPVFGSRKIGERVEVFEEPTGWKKVDRQLQEMRLRLDTAEAEEQFQSVGLLCREILISVAQEVYDSTQHLPTDGIHPSETDAKRMLDSIFESELRGSGSDEARSHAKAAVRLALALQHKRSADFKTASLCAEGTMSVVNMIAIVANRRGRSTR